MNFSIPVGNNHLIRYNGNFFTGAEQLTVDGKIIPLSDLNILKEEGFGWFGSRKVEFLVEDIKVVFEIEQPFLCPSRRPIHTESSPMRNSFMK
jgi:hypothetical protein